MHIQYVLYCKMPCGFNMTCGGSVFSVFACGAVLIRLHVGEATS